MRQLYHWTSEAMEGYTSGDIIAIGESIEDARLLSDAKGGE